MANLNNLGQGRKLLDEVLSIQGPKVKHWYNQQNLINNKSSNNYNVQPKILNPNKK